jgi:response regulator of citrate/malate metabolism
MLLREDVSAPTPDAAGGAARADHLVGLIVTTDDAFRKQVTRPLIAAGVRVTDDRSATDIVPDITIIDIRGESNMNRVERVHSEAPTAGILVVASDAEPDLILEAMRAGANEFLVWPPPEEKFQVAIHRMTTKREAALGREPATRLLFLGAKGG